MAGSLQHITICTGNPLGKSTWIAPHSYVGHRGAGLRPGDATLHVNTIRLIRGIRGLKINPAVVISLQPGAGVSEGSLVPINTTGLHPDSAVIHFLVIATILSYEMPGCYNRNGQPISTPDRAYTPDKSSRYKPVACNATMYWVPET